jgi:hypothetical protein
MRFIRLPLLPAALGLLAGCCQARAAEPRSPKEGITPAMSTTSISARISVEPAVWPAGSLQDVTIRLILRNEGPKTALVYPLAIRPIGRTSIAGEGIEWTLEAKPAGGDTPIPIQEIRTYYGPPGEPRSEKWLRSKGKVSLSPGREHETKIEACWIPNSLLKPEQLVPAVLDPDGMDGIGPRNFQPPPGQAMPPPLSESFSFARASVLIIDSPCKAMKQGIGKEPELLRGQVVAFFPAPGAYLLGARYVQDSWMQIGEKLAATAAAVRISAGER